MGEWKSISEYQIFWLKENTIDLLTKERDELLNEKKELTQKVEEDETKIT